MSSLPVNLSTMQLAYIVAIDRHRTWAEAAASLGVTPSALSQGVAELERRLGVALYSAEGRRRVPLDHTATVVTYAQRVVADLDELGRWLESVRTGSIGRLRVGLIDIAAVHYCRAAINSFRSARPDLDTVFTVAPTGALLDGLDRGELDVAVCVDPEGRGNFDAAPLIRDELAVYAPPGTPSARFGRPASWGPWLLFPGGSRTRAAIDRQLAELGAPRTVSLESHQPDVLREMVGLGLGWTVLPTAQAEHGPSPLARIDRSPLLTRTISAVSRRGGARHPAVQTFIEELAHGFVAQQELKQP